MRLANRVAALTGATTAVRSRKLQSLWGGYGEAVRFDLTGASWSSVVVKHVQPGRGGGRSHDRKLRSYEVEQAFYRDWSARCGDRCRVPRCLHVERVRGEWLFVLEDLDAAGFVGRRRRVSDAQLDLCLQWLARFHATFLGVEPEGLWPVGT